MDLPCKKMTDEEYICGFHQHSLPLPLVLGEGLASGLALHRDLFVALPVVLELARLASTKQDGMAATTGSSVRIIKGG